MRTTGPVRQVGNISCNLCGGTDCIPAFGTIETPVVRCRHCGLVFTGRRPEFREIVASRYNREYFEAEYLPQLVRDKETSDVERGEYLRTVEKGLPHLGNERPRLLDVGSGAGFLLEQARTRAWEVQGLEVSEAAASYCQARLSIPVVVGELRRGLFADQSFHAVTMLDVIEHLPDPLSTLKIVVSILKEGCPLLIVTPNFGSVCRYLLGLEAYGIWPDEHLYYFTSATLRKLLQAAGFRKIWIASRDIYPQNLSAIMTNLRVTRKIPNSIARPPDQLKERFYRSKTLRQLRRLGNRVLARVHWGDKLVTLAHK